MEVLKECLFVFCNVNLVVTHVSPEAGIIEIVDSDGHQVKPGTPGQVVCTGLQEFTAAIDPVQKSEILLAGPC